MTPMPVASAATYSSNNNRTKSPTEVAPIFLRKTYKMIDTCNPEIATWSEDGLSFVVKDTDIFQRDIIGQYFKHNNFSSFVRQLNFYGFRKIKSDPLLIKDEETSVEAKYWRFRHEKFQQGRADLLPEIKKSSHIEAAEKQEVEALKSEVNDLKVQMAQMRKDMEQMAALMGTMMQNQQQQQQYAQDDAASPPKKRRMTYIKTEAVTTDMPPIKTEPMTMDMPPIKTEPTTTGFSPIKTEPEQVLSRPGSACSEVYHVNYVHAPPPPPPPAVNFSTKDNSFGLISLSDLDGDILDTLQEAFVLGDDTDCHAADSGEVPDCATSTCSDLVLPEPANEEDSPQQ